MGRICSTSRSHRWNIFVILTTMLIALMAHERDFIAGVEAQGVPPLTGGSVPPLPAGSVPPLSGGSVPPLPGASVPPLPGSVPTNSSSISTESRNEFNQALDSIAVEVQKNFSDCISNILEVNDNSVLARANGDIRADHGVTGASKATEGNAANESDKKNTFGYDQMEDVLLQCASDTGSDFVSRVCMKEEIGLYFVNIETMRGAGIPPNANCNSSSWSRACEAGWAGKTNAIYSSTATVIPSRLTEPAPCCEGFFCPRGLTCMMPCPLGAWCPYATFNSSSDSCEPFGYPSLPNTSQQCGGADLWLSYKDSRGTFCGGTAGSNGKYCPDTLTEITCEKGHYCRIGSTDQTKCTFLTSCGKEGLKSENLKSYGILLVVILFVSLLLTYNCSEQVMHVRERRKAKVRDNAAREAHEKFTAAERWKRAAEAAKTATKNAISRTVSRSWSKLSASRAYGPPHIIQNEIGATYGQDQMEGSSRAHSLANSVGLMGIQNTEGQRPREQEFHLLRHDSGARDGSSRVPWSQDLYPEGLSSHFDLYGAEGEGGPSTVLQGDQEEQPGPKEGGDVEVGEGGNPAVAHTRKQIYKYAYGQLEKEKYKQHSKPTSLRQLVESTGFINMMRGTGRPQLEVKFLDLSLTLKGSGKKILSNVTGKFSPSRVTAIMGPSGAGKTTFLHALAGKESGSETTGQVFINGHPGSIQTYRRIIGFVPQDDIVHGSLTVEENLAFSAKYRLPVDTHRQDRVLVVERIINTLGLTSIRDSLVGTVEKRGISGGQRKRVNVGMELVMEPSLLLLDEPTSGLDSTSSRLVVQSLRREATLGVNVLLVVHQPSYGLFRMFDDVMFLGKGGYTVYLGPVAEIESYFSSLGFTVPERINPPDLYMDVLEGLAAPENDSSFDVKSLPVLWMCHNGYHIPRELQDSVHSGSEDSLRMSAEHKSFVQDLFDELRIYVLVQWDIWSNSFLTVRDMSGRKTPGFWKQFRLIMQRVLKQRLRESRLLAQDYVILLLAGICLGALANWKDYNVGGSGYLYTIIAVALLVMIASLRTFSEDKLEFWRESSSGINKIAFFLAKDTVDHFNTVVKPLVYLSVFYFFNDPRSSFASNYTITLILVYCCTGLAYIPAIILKPQPAQLVAVFLPVIATILVTTPHTGFVGKLVKISYAYWALQAYTISNAERYSGVWFITRCEVFRGSGYRLDNWYLCIGVLVAFGIAARILAYLCLLAFHRNRQK